jgi:acid phosphatase family membrane protein YuiD
MPYSVLILPLAAGVIAQLIKFFIPSNHQRFDVRNIFKYAGMPSGHSAIVIGLMTITALDGGLSSPLFAISTILAVIVIRDALGIRRFLGQHGRILNALVKDLKDDKLLDEEYPHLLERIGHTPAQVAVGGLIGLAVSTIGYYTM